MGAGDTGLAFGTPNAFYSRVEQHNDALVAIENTGETPELAAARDAWPGWLPSSLVNLGLDLRGGAHLLAEVKVSDVYADRMDGYWPELRNALRDERATVGTIRRQPSPDDVLRIKISQPEGMARAMEVIRSLASPVGYAIGCWVQRYRSVRCGRYSDGSVVRG